MFTGVHLLHFLTKHPIPALATHPKVWSFYISISKKVKGTSLFYNILQDKDNLCKSSTVTKWETDFRSTFTPSQWRAAFNSISKVTHCVSHWEMALKITNRWYYTPFRLARFSSSCSPQCWCNCGQVGNLLHTFWECPTLTSFWRQIFQLISTCTGILTPPCPALALHNVGLDRYPHTYRPVVSHILLAACCCVILKQLKSLLAANLSETINIIHQNHT